MTSLNESLCEAFPCKIMFVFDELLKACVSIIMLLICFFLSLFTQHSHF